MNTHTTHTNHRKDIFAIFSKELEGYRLNNNTCYSPVDHQCWLFVYQLWPAYHTRVSNRCWTSDSHHFTPYPTLHMVTDNTSINRILYSSSISLPPQSYCTQTIYTYIVPIIPLCMVNGSNVMAIFGQVNIFIFPRRKSYSSIHECDMSLSVVCVDTKMYMQACCSAYMPPVK